MGRARVTQLRISGMRAIASVALDLEGLTVLVGDNGTGKSTVLEALEILRLAVKPVDFVNDVLTKGHGGVRGLLRRGADELRLGVTVETEIEERKATLSYDLAIGLVGRSPQVLREDLRMLSKDGTWYPLLRRNGASVVFLPGFEPPDDTALEESWNKREATPERLEIGWFRQSSAPGFSRVAEALEEIEVHAPFETRPLWQQRELDIRVGPRWPSTVERSESLSRYALNLPNAFQQLRNMGEDVWSRVLERARLGLGDDVRGFVMSPAGRGNIELEVVYGSAPDEPLPAEYLSEGQLGYLGFLALAELHQHRSVLAFDEPELHLHPSLLARVVWLLEEASERAPVILATHSDRLLDALADPVSNVVLCDLDEHRAVRLRRPNANKLAEWLEDYRGFGSLRAEGYEAHVFDEPANEKE